ncbi:TrkH family potassium uptake protein [Rhodobacteraceae bacterium HSP-20]|uniref:TrkH family potassium uptake protein n=1 Tax=Paragemmobacter amnigenus TaxID=2852097 RepID=A0ABS6J3S7_9RHOB|nr:potassium transporter TrkG [Rhodobacter amnigenus]MBU9698420.1 TrkH family potassium uptake protein [Rhodobacter amnigenus]MBV4389647.1 TrkH family potassium uptake protein [Rhodobacter amnigenus]
MLRRLSELPLLVLLMGITALSMWLPAAHAAILRDHETGRAFFYSGVILLILTAMIGIATVHQRARNPARANLAALVAAYVVLPVLMALPLVQAMPDTSWVNAWLEMVSAFSTTGLTAYDPPRLPDSIHLWRAQVGWMGGFFILVAAVAILAPMTLGGMEVMSGRVPGRGSEGLSQITATADPARRVARQAAAIFPVYAGITVALWVVLLMAGTPNLPAFIHALSTISTSGISATGGLPTEGHTFPAELAIFLVLFAALTRRLWPGSFNYDPGTGLRDDPELRMALAILLTIPAILFLRHWIAAPESEAANLPAAFGALWGTLFTTLSFLTTTGFTSADWVTARNWSGLETPGLVLAGLAIFGGGIATTAGGVKLLRVYALFRHGERELERLIHPNSVGGAGQSARRLRREGAYVAWIFFMLFALSIAAFVAALALVDIPFETALILTLSALSTCGPLADVASADPIPLAQFSVAAKTIIATAMVIGRLELLAILVLLAPDSWRQ